jgi:hypothetical protein
MNFRLSGSCPNFSETFLMSTCVGICADHASCHIHARTLDNALTGSQPSEIHLLPPPKRPNPPRICRPRTS